MHRSLLASVEVVQFDVLLDSIETLNLRVQFPRMIARVEADAELIEPLSFIHAVGINTLHNQQVTRRELALLLLNESGVGHVKRLDALHVHIILGVLDKIAAAIVVTRGVGWRQDDKRTAVVRERLAEAVREKHKNSVTRFVDRRSRACDRTGR